VSVPIANPTVSETAREAVDRVLQSGMIADGEEVRAFEDEFAEYVGTDHAVATSSGTTALHAMLEAAGIGAGDVVVTTPFSFISSANAVRHAGATPVFGDIDPETYNLDPDTVGEIVERRDDVAAIMPVHLYGLPAGMEEFREIAAEHDLLLFEDAAQAHGATYGGEMVGSIGDAAAFSFYPTKNMTTGEGGMITTDNTELAEHARRLADHGRESGYRHVEVGYNYRMTNMQAAIGQDQLSRLPGWVEKRRENAGTLTDTLASVDGIVTPTVPEGRTHAYHQYTVRVPDQEVATEALSDAGIGYGIYYPMPIPAQPAYNVETACPVASTASDAVLSLPVHPCVLEEDLNQIVRAVSRGVEVSA
jgi:dTDP-4-amino-4,6-dideoxygalactose transaminase